MVLAIATSAVRDAENSGAFLAELRERFALNASILDGEEEARLTYLGAGAGRAPSDGTLVIDIGGGSTELVVGSGRRSASTPRSRSGTVRHTERYLRTDPPTAPELEALAERHPQAALRGAGGGGPLRDRTRASRSPARRPRWRRSTRSSTPTTPSGSTATCSRSTRSSTCARCSRRSRWRSASRCTGLHPGRAPTIVAGVVILIQVMRAFGLQEIEVSEHDILYGAALEAAGSA